MSRDGTIPVTVAIATRDRPDGLQRCLVGLASGSVLPDEVLVVDQGSVTAERAMTEGLFPDSVTVRSIRRREAGLSRSRNRAFENARNSFVAVTDDDCVPDSGWLHGLYAGMTRHPEPDAVTGSVLPLGPPEPGTFATASRASEDAADYCGRPAPWIVGTGGNFLARRERIVEIGGYDERLGVGSPGAAGEDIDLIDRLLRAGALIRYEPSAVVRHARKPLAARLSTRLSYGRGIGAVCGLRLREGDISGALHLYRWARLRCSIAVQLLRKSPSVALQEEWLILRGTAAGLRYGLSIPGNWKNRDWPVP